MTNALALQHNKKEEQNNDCRPAIISLRPAISAVAELLFII